MCLECLSGGNCAVERNPRRLDLSHTAGYQQNFGPILTTDPLPYSEESLFVYTVLPAVVSCALVDMSHSRNPFILRFVDSFLLCLAKLTTATGVPRS